MAVSGQAIVDYIKQFIGTPYVWGGQSPGGFDCSGLLVYGFKNFGINLSRTTYTQIGQGQAINIKGLGVGDLVFFETDGGTKGPDHVGIYAGNGKMIHAPRPGKAVEITDMTSGYWVDRFVGGRRMSGVSASGGSSDDFATPEEEKKLTPEELASNYGWSIGFFNSIPELKKLFDLAIKETWTDGKFQAELRETKWWQSTSETARQAQLMEKTDPATWQATKEATLLQVRMIAAEIGAAVPEKQIAKMADTIMRTGMQEDAIRYALGDYVTFTKTTPGGEAGMHVYTMKQYASQYGVELDDQTLRNQAARVVKKIATTEDFQKEVREQAKSAFPGWAAQIDAGITMEDIASPYRNMMANELELPVSTIDMNDTVIRSALNGLNGEGQPVGMTLTDFQSSLKNDPRWRKTQKSQDEVMAVGSQVLKDMGLAF